MSGSRVAVVGTERTGNINPIYSFSLTAGETASAWVAGLNNVPLELTLFNSSGVVLADSYQGSAGRTQGFDGFTAPSSGRYFVRVNGVAGAEFNLVVSMGAAFTTLVHTSPSSALDISETGKALGYLPNGSTTDFDSFRANEGDTLTISSLTPPEAQGTTTDIVLLLYGPYGNLVAEAGGNAADGKNAVIQANAMVSGVYTIGVAAPASGGSAAGEYGLVVQGDTGGFANVAVTATSPAAGSAVEHLTNYVVTFNQPVYAPSLSAGELTIGGIPALSVSLVNGNTVDWAINPAALPEGTGTVTPTLSADAAGRRVEGLNLTSLANVSRSFQTGPITLSQFQPMQPSEGMVYDTTATGSLASSSVVDSYYVSINPSQTLAVIATPLTANMSATVTLISPSGQTIGLATSPAAGRPALLPGTRSLGGGTYTIQVSGGAGQYRLVTYLNAYIDPSGYGGAANNSIAGATPIDPYATTFIGHDDRTAVLGQEIAGDLNPVYSFALDQGESASVALSSTNGTNVSFAIYDSDGVLVALSDAGATNYAQGLNEFVAPADGAYFVQVSGAAGASSTWLSPAAPTCR